MASDIIHHDLGIHLGGRYDELVAIPDKSSGDGVDAQSVAKADLAGFIGNAPAAGIHQKL